MVVRLCGLFAAVVDHAVVEEVVLRRVHHARHDGQTLPEPHFPRRLGTERLTGLGDEAQPLVGRGQLGRVAFGVGNRLAEHGEASKYVQDINRWLATAKTPWCVKEGDLGVISFYPYADHQLKR